MRALQNLENYFVIFCMGVRCPQGPGSNVDPIIAILQQLHIRKAMEMNNFWCYFVQMIHLNQSKTVFLQHQDILCPAFAERTIVRSGWQ